MHELKFAVELKKYRRGAYIELLEKDCRRMAKLFTQLETLLPIKKFDLMNTSICPHLQGITSIPKK